MFLFPFLPVKGTCRLPRIVLTAWRVLVTFGVLQSESFQPDIFPDTYAGEPALSAAAYFGGENGTVRKMSMDPAKNGGRTSSAGTACDGIHARFRLPHCVLFRQLSTACDVTSVVPPVHQGVRRLFLCF